MLGSSRHARAFVVLAAAGGAMLPTAAAASVPTAVDGLAGVGDVAGLIAGKVPAAAARGWAASLPPGAGRHAALGLLRSGGSAPTILVSRAVATGSPARARKLAAALRRRPSARWAREDAAAARIAPRRLVAAAAVIWRAGAIVGRVVVSGPPHATARRLAKETAARIVARVRAQRARTPWQDATTLHGGRGPSTRQALAAFSIAFGIRIPGVPPPRGTVDFAADGTLALRWAVAHLPAMNAAQRAVVERTLARLRGPEPATARAAALETDWTDSPAYTAAATAAAAVLTAHLHIALTLELHVGTSRVVSHKEWMAVTEPVGVSGAKYSGVPVSCWITMYPNGAALTGVFATEVITHEVFHCFQAQMGNDLGLFYGRRNVQTDWMIEGGADWAACLAVPGPLPEPAFIDWLTKPEEALPDRAYDGVGLFLLLTANGVDVWSRWKDIAGASSTDDAYYRAVLAERDQIGRGWASSLFQEPARGTAWDPGDVPCRPQQTAAPEPYGLLVDNGTSGHVHVSAFAAQLYRLHSDADVIHTVVPDGDMRLSSLQPPVDESNLSDRYYCTDAQSNCSCPRLSTRSGPPPLAIDADGGSVFAVSGGSHSVTGTVEGLTREKYCGVKLGRIVPGHSIGKLYLGQTRRSALRAVPKLVPGGPRVTRANAQYLFLNGGGGAFPSEYEIAFGPCSAVLFKSPAALAACRMHFPKSSPDIIGLVETGSPGYVTATGLGPGVPASAVIAAVGESKCARDTPGDENSSWFSCVVPETGTRGTIYGFAGKKDAETVLVVAVYDRDILPTNSLGAGQGT